MSNVFFSPSFAGVGDMLRAPFMVREMLRRAEKVKGFAEATAPYDETDSDGMHYRDDFHVESSPRGGIHKDRAEAQVVNTNSVNYIVEFGNKKTPRHRTLGRSLDAAKD